MHPDQLEVDLELVRRLVAARFPDWAPLGLTRVASTGTMNAMFRLGDGLAVRVPLRGTPAVVGAELAREAAAGAELSGRLPIPVPVQAGLADAGTDFPLPWSVQTWLPGEVAGAHGTDGTADDLAGLVLALRAVPTAGRTFTGSYRGGELAAHDAWITECLARSAGLVDVAAASALWRRLRTLPRPDELRMCHGDLIPSNLLVDADGRLRGLLDLGTYGAADPALDLVGAWHCLESRPRTRFRAGIGCDDAEWARGQAWALEQAMGLAWYYRDSNPAASALGRRTVARILAAPAA